MHNWARDLFPICRSITGPGVRATLSYIKALIPDLLIHEVPTGATAFDWVVPDEWSIKGAYLEHESGERVLDLSNSNLHVVGYSEPVDSWLDLNELQTHIHSLPEQPDAIPYVTSYYSRNWGFCMTEQQRSTLKPGRYHAVIDSELKQGVLNYGELILPGHEENEVFLSTYICHPSLANNELSGPVVATALSRYLSEKIERRYTYRIVFIPETIGSIVYLSRNLAVMKKNVIAGFNISCVGDERAYSFLPSRTGDTLADFVAQHVLKHIDPEFRRYSWLDRGSDERQYCSPGIDLPVASMMRTKYGEYPEYHTSLDNLDDVVTPTGLAGGYQAIKLALELIENNRNYRSTVLCEPQMGKRGLYPTLSTKGGSRSTVKCMMDFLSLCDGTTSLIEIADKLNSPAWDLYELIETLYAHSLIESV